MRAQVLQRELVQKTVHQLGEYNQESNGSYLAPLMVAEKFNKNWDKNVSGLSDEELVDLDNARANLENYEKIYSIFEYSAEITRLCNMVETKVCANNPSLPMNVYRGSGATDIEAVFPEIEKCLEAYYDLIDDCEAYPEWQKKIQKELGGTVSYLALAIDESSRDEATARSEVFKRFDLEKQIYFK